jgi:hypothetical protein
MTLQIFLVIFASILSILGNVPYLKSILKKEIEPHPFSWFAWSIVSLTVLFGAYLKGGGIGVIPILVSEIFTILIFLFSLKYGFKNFDKKDIAFILLAIIGLVPWYLTKDPTYSVVIMVLIDLVAFFPTIRKTLNSPESENNILYQMNFLRHFLILFSLDKINIATSFHSFAMIIINLIMIVLISKNLRKINLKLFK